jgi:hypothetical protein
MYWGLVRSWGWLGIGVGGRATGPCRVVVVPLEGEYKKVVNLEGGWREDGWRESHRAMSSFGR